MGFNSAFKGLKTLIVVKEVLTRPKPLLQFSHEMNGYISDIFLTIQNVNNSQHTKLSLRTSFFQNMTLTPCVIGSRLLVRNMFLQNVENLSFNVAVSYPRRTKYSTVPARKPQVCQNNSCSHHSSTFIKDSLYSLMQTTISIKETAQPLAVN